ncbi:MAG: hypothetical protein ACI8W3_002585, partial [Myxococcota bacterium]
SKIPLGPGINAHGMPVSARRVAAKLVACGR